ncbi:MAG: heavy metal translocating P-type ATPase metal-binding domain-containing protein [Cyclobacteriaceae bacterium]|nr:heavy metal translocating P-type ATPase metal-binding domain-containing protein [Cyclobacteriaceae bacterium]
MEVVLDQDIKCYHCGQACEDTLWMEDKAFCCHGCKTVFEILSANDLCEYYDLDKNPGIQLKQISEETYAYLDEKDIRRKTVEFDSDSFSRVRFYIPAIHCVSCIWLLENLQKLNTGVLRSEVNFARKSVTLDFNPEKVKLSGVARLLASLAYAPQISLEQEATVSVSSNKSLVIKLAVAGFCFGNIMLFSFPEYLGLDQGDESLKFTFSWLNVVLSIPVFFYSGFDYFRSAWKSFEQRQINIDVPIAVGLLALFARSIWDIVSGFGPGYLDSFTGLVFFLLIGRWFQSKTYESLAFDRDFKSYFPLAIHKLMGLEWKPVVIYDLKKGDQIRIRNMEIIPADSLLLDAEAFIDYSFVTGESRPVKVKLGELVYAGGRLIGQPVTMVVDKKTSQSHLTSLWNHAAFQKVEESKYKKIIDRAARRFTWIVLGIAVITAGYWYAVDPSQMWLIITSVLMVACPCALALAAPFTYGNMLRVFGKNNFYLKNADVIERLATINAVVFDKTGTVTHGQSPDVQWEGDLNDNQLGWIKVLTSYSTHPLSNVITKSIRKPGIGEVTKFKEFPGKGIEGEIDGSIIKIGSPAFTGFTGTLDDMSSKVFVSINQEVKGYFTITTSIRKDIKNMLSRLGGVCAALLSGDNEADKARMGGLFHPSVQLLFNQSPHDKLDFIRKLQLEEKKVMMLGDGLNDSGALKQSDVGIAVTDDTGVFTPACDGILQGDKISSLDKFMQLAKASTIILKTGFVISFLYNAIALSFAVTGHLTPLVAAILMPISSISVVVFTTVAVNWVANHKLNAATSLDYRVTTGSNLYQTKPVTTF